MDNCTGRIGGKGMCAGGRKKFKKSRSVSSNVENPQDLKLKYKRQWFNHRFFKYQIY